MIGLAEARPEWVVGFLDETWWSRLARPALKQLERRRRAPAPHRTIGPQGDDPDPKAISCYGLYLPEFEKVGVGALRGR